MITSDSDERTSLATWRFLCAMAAILIVTTSTLDLVEFFGGDDRAAGFQATAGVWGGVAIVCLLATFYWTRERVSDSPREKSNVRQDIVDLLSNRPWLALFLLSIFISAQNALRSGTSLYYFEHFQRATPIFEHAISNFGLFNAVGLIAVMLGVLLSSPLSEQFGKRNTFQGCLLLSAAFMAAFVLLPRDAKFGLFGLQIAMQLAFAPTIPLLWSMMADVADFGEWKNGRRSTALAFASIVFGMKVGGGFGLWLGGELLHQAGYVGQGTPGDEALRTMARSISVFPAIALVIGVVALLFYGIDRPTELEMERSLRERREQDAAQTPAV